MSLTNIYVGHEFGHEFNRFVEITNHNSIILATQVDLGYNDSVTQTQLYQCFFHAQLSI